MSFYATFDMPAGNGYVDKPQHNDRTAGKVRMRMAPEDAGACRMVPFGLQVPRRDQLVQAIGISTTSAPRRVRIVQT